MEIIWGHCILSCLEAIYMCTVSQNQRKNRSNGYLVAQYCSIKIPLPYSQLTGYDVNVYIESDIPSGKLTVRYWKWPSRNSWFTPKNGGFPVCKLFLRLPEGKCLRILNITFKNLLEMQKCPRQKGDPTADADADGSMMDSKTLVLRVSKLFHLDTNTISLGHVQTCSLNISEPQ